MNDRWYTVDQISEMLKLHPRTLRRYINEGKLRANKVGKQFRISGHDLSIFVEGQKISGIEEMATGIRPRSEVSAVADIDTAGRDDADRIERTLLAAMNSKDPSYGRSSASIQRSAGNEKIRVVLWGSIDFVITMLEYVSLLTNGRDV